MQMQQKQKQKEIFEVKSDVPDPTGSGMRGMTSGIDLSKSAIGHPVIHYKAKDGSEHLLTADVYALPGEPMKVYILCPECKNHLTIRQDNKAIDYDRNVVPRIPGFTTEELFAQLNISDLGGRISIEPFRCTWEEKPDLRRSYGFGVCGWGVSITNNVAKPL